MGLKEVTGVRQFTTFTREGLVKRIYELSFTTEKTAGEFTLEIAADDYTAELGKKMAKEKAEEIDRVFK